MNAVEKISDHMPASMPIPQATSSNQLLAVLSRMMADPSVDIERIERGAALYERALARDAEADFNRAMASAQAAMRRIQTDAKNDQTKSKYATYAAVDEIARPVYGAQGFSLSFDTGEGATEGCNRILCYVSHGSHTRTYHIDMPADGKGARGGDVMTKTHATGAAMTYGRRYLLSMIFNLVVGEDTDGNTPEHGAGPLNPAELAQIEELVTEAKVNPELFASLFQVKELSAIPSAKFENARLKLNKRISDNAKVK